MKVNELIDEYEKCTKIKRTYDFKKHITRTYMPYSEKLTLVRNLVRNSSYITVNGKEIYKRDTGAMLFAFTLRLLSGYTDIEIPEQEVLIAYDSLMEKGIMNMLMQEIPDAEIKILQGMLDMERDDLEANTRSLVSFLETKTESMQIMLEKFEEAIKSPEIQKKIVEFTK